MTNQENHRNQEEKNQEILSIWILIGEKISQLFNHGEIREFEKNISKSQKKLQKWTDVLRVKLILRILKLFTNTSRLLRQNVYAFSYFPYQIKY